MAFNKSIVGRTNGRVTANSDNNVVEANLGITEKSVVIFKRIDSTGIAQGARAVTLDPGVGFTFTSFTGDTATYDYLILGG